MSGSAGAKGNPEVTVRPPLTSEGSVIQFLPWPS
jgi:hypothetical protein